MFKSKMIFDPNKAEQFPWGNRMGRTVGLEFHWPQYWNCRKKDFDLGWLWVGGHRMSKRMKMSRHLEAVAHSRCRWPYNIHRANKGYVYWWGPKRRYAFYYMGQRHDRDPKFPILVTKHNMYMRWFDNGPQNKPQKPIEPEFLDALRERHRNEADKIRAEMTAFRESLDTFDKTPMNYLWQLQDEAKNGYHQELNAWVDDKSGVARVLEALDEVQEG